MSSSFFDLQVILRGETLSPETAGGVTYDELRAALCTAEVIRLIPELNDKEAFSQNLFLAILQGKRVFATGKTISYGVPGWMEEMQLQQKDFGTMQLSVVNMAVRQFTPPAPSSHSSNSYSSFDGGSSNN
ncbi:MAG: hypothetical protein IKU70_13910, partial [Clostridia bacterium]|nr:hypothetical protein [Clostridia bacterium]